MSQIMPFLSMGMQVYGGYQQGKAQEAQANAEASMMETNAAYSEERADAARRSALWDERILRERVASVASTQRAQFGKSGVALEGSPTQVMLETITRGEMDAIAIRTSGADEYSAGIEQGLMLRKQAKNTREIGAKYPSMGLMSGLTSAFSTGMSTGAFGNWGIGSGSALRLPNTSFSGGTASVGTGAHTSVGMG